MEVMEMKPDPNEFRDSPNYVFDSVGGGALLEPSTAVGGLPSASSSLTPAQRRRQPVKPKGSGPGRPLTADRKRPYPCSQCTSCFGSKMELEEHQNSHTGQKPFQCDICMAKFNRRSTLWNHKRIHSDTKPFTCPVCQMTFKWKNSLKCHREMHVRKNESSDDCQTPDGCAGSASYEITPITYALAKRKTEELQQCQSPDSGFLSAQPCDVAMSSNEASDKIDETLDECCAAVMRATDDSSIQVDSPVPVKKPRRNARNPLRPARARRNATGGRKARVNGAAAAAAVANQNATNLVSSMVPLGLNYDQTGIMDNSMNLIQQTICLDEQTLDVTGQPCQSGNASAQSTPPSDPAPSYLMNDLAKTLYGTDATALLLNQSQLMPNTQQFGGNIFSPNGGSAVYNPTGSSNAPGAPNGALRISTNQGVPFDTLQYQPNVDLTGFGQPNGQPTPQFTYANYANTQGPMGSLSIPTTTTYYSSPAPSTYTNSVMAQYGAPAQVPNQQYTPNPTQTAPNPYGMYQPSSTPTQPQFVEGMLVKVLPFSEW